MLDSVSSPHSKRAYARALDDFARWSKEEGQGSSFGKALVQRYRSWLEEKGLAPSSINIRLAAIRKLATEAADNGLLDPAVASAIGRVKGAAQKGKRTGRWLSREEAGLLLRDSGEETLKAKRDRALLCLLVGAGLRREEVILLGVAHIQQREGRWVTAAGITEGKLFRAVDKAGRITGETLSSQAVYLIVTDRARRLGLELAPHDVRRTFAKLVHKGKVPIGQIQLSLGHESIQTTERYLGVRQDLTDAPCDHLGIELERE